MSISLQDRLLVVTGSSGLIGSEVVTHFANQGWRVFGVDNNMRRDLFGPSGDTRWNQRRLADRFSTFTHIELDVRDRPGINRLLKELRPSLIVHAAAQPSHDLASKRPLDDFDINAVGTMNLLTAAHEHARDTVFVHMSTNKVYGDRPNKLKLKELLTRWVYDEPGFEHGITEDFPIDNSVHSIFGASKVAADVMVQEYGKYFGMKTCCLRGGCLTGPNHSGVALHGFLSYLVKCNVEGRLYTVLGHKGKQVRDNIHAHDVARLIEAIWNNPRCGEVYNVGGGLDNACSILEAFDLVAQITGRAMNFEYVDEPRIGDHICYYSDLRKLADHFPEWRITKRLPTILEEISLSWLERTPVDEIRQRIDDSAATIDDHAIKPRANTATVRSN